MTPEAFRHLPRLRDKLTPPQHSALRVTPEVLAEWDRRARDLGQPPHWRLGDGVREASRRALLDGLDVGAGLWVYAYGSLMWDPGFHFDEVRVADLDGYRRRFAFRTRLGRGTPERPALMLSLEAGTGRCQGLALRIPAPLVEAESEILWRREMVRGSYCPAMLPVATPQGGIPALVFTVNCEHPDYVGELPLADTAAAIASATGPMGTNRDYLEKLAAQLETLGVDDPYVAQLLDRVRCG